MGLHGKLRDSESPRFFSGATDHGYRKKIRKRTLDASLVRAGRKDRLSHAGQGLEESMVQERLEIKTDQDFIRKVSLDLSAKLINDPKRVASVADKFRKKHGAADVKKYYTGFDAAVELSLP